jgi:hypothetical protein
LNRSPVVGSWNEFRKFAIRFLPLPFGSAAGVREIDYNAAASVSVFSRADCDESSILFFSNDWGNLSAFHGRRVSTQREYFLSAGMSRLSKVRADSDPAGAICAKQITAAMLASESGFDDSLRCAAGYG